MGQKAKSTSVLPKVPLILVSALLSGCVATSTGPQSGVENLFSSTKAEQTKPLETNRPLEGQLSAAEPTPPPAASKNDAKEKISPAVRNALVPTPKPEAPAQVATSDVVKSGGAAAKEQKETAAATGADANAEVKETQLALAKPEAQPEKKSSGFFGNLFSNSGSSNSKSSKSRTPTTRAELENSTTVRRTRAVAPKPTTKTDAKQPAKTAQSKQVEVKLSKREGKSTGGGLPGVSLKRLFGFGDDVDEIDEPVKVASVANLARRGTHGLLLQRPNIQVGCFPSRLVKILRRVERRFGRTPIVTSGYRSPAHNRRVRGARNSTHIKCLAADIQVKGVSKWRLAKYLRTVPGRGGVGTYCHTNSVHIDIANKRDWNVRCRRKRRRG